MESSISFYELSRKLRAMQIRKRIVEVAVFAGVAGMFLGAVFGAPVLCIFMFVLLFAGSFYLSSLRKKIKREFGAPLMRQALSQVFTRVEYDALHFLPEQFLELSSMEFPFDIDRVEGSDYIHAEYQGLDLKMSDIRLIDRRRSGKNTRSVTVFEGIWLVCDFHKEITCDLLLQERNGFSFRFADKLRLHNTLIETENAAFNEKFLISASREHDAFYLLTPQMMERILRMDASGGGVSYLRFTKEGKVHIAINSGKNFFELNASWDLDRILANFQREIRYVTDLIDELRLAETI